MTDLRSAWSPSPPPPLPPGLAALLVAQALVACGGCALMSGTPAARRPLPGPLRSKVGWCQELRLLSETPTASQPLPGPLQSKGGWYQGLRLVS